MKPDELRLWLKKALKEDASLAVHIANLLGYKSPGTIRHWAKNGIPSYRALALYELQKLRKKRA